MGILNDKLLFKKLATKIESSEQAGSIIATGPCLVIYKSLKTLTVSTAVFVTLSHPESLHLRSNEISALLLF